MGTKGVHYLAQASIRQRLAQNASDIEKVSVSLKEALKLGDLSENSEYDATKEAMAKLTKERDMLTPVLSMPAVRSSDNIAVFEEGSVIDIKVYSVLSHPVYPDTNEYAKLVSENAPAFEGTIMLGGTLPIQDLIEDAALSVETPVGSYLIGKPSGSYIVKVPGGFVPVIARKLKSTEFTPEDIRCSYNA